MWSGFPAINLSSERSLQPEAIVEEPHRTHKEVPIGYWTGAVVPVMRALARWRRRRDIRRSGPPPAGAAVRREIVRALQLRFDPLTAAGEPTCR